MLKAKFNVISFLILFLYLCTWFAMQYQSNANPYEELLTTLPLVFFMLFCCAMLSPLLKKERVTKLQVYLRDFLLYFLAFFIGTLMIIILNYQNSDVRGWWIFYLYYMLLIDSICSVIYSSILSFIKYRNLVYSYASSLLVIFCFILINYLPQRIDIFFVRHIEVFYLVTLAFLLFHFLVAFLLKFLHSCDSTRSMPK
jgi:hypothetical protein